MNSQEVKESSGRLLGFLGIVTVGNRNRLHLLLPDLRFWLIDQSRGVRRPLLLLHFGGSSAFCFGIDIALFALIFWAGGSAMLATIGARIISGAINFWINKSVVFGRRDSENSLGEALQYLALWLTLMLISGTVVTAASQRATIIVVLIKILVDVSLFLASYYAQSRFVFAKARGRDTGPGSG